MQVIAAKYGTDASDVDGMINAINADSAYYEEKALEAGMPVEKYKEFMNLQAQNKAMEEAQRRAANLRQEEQTWARWDAESEQCKSLYPDFDIRYEIENNESVSKATYALLDTRKIKNIGWEPQYSVKDGLKRTYTIKKETLGSM